MDTYENEICVVSSSSEYDTKSYMAWKALYSFFHNLGFDYKNLKVSGWIKDKTTGFVMPWYPDSNYDAGIEFNNYGFHIDECQFSVTNRTFYPIFFKHYISLVLFTQKNAGQSST